MSALERRVATLESQLKILETRVKSQNTTIDTLTKLTATTGNLCLSATVMVNLALSKLGITNEQARKAIIDAGLQLAKGHPIQPEAIGTASDDSGQPLGLPSPASSGTNSGDARVENVQGQDGGESNQGDTIDHHGTGSVDGIGTAGEEGE